MKTFATSVFVLATIVGTDAHAADIEKGETLFGKKCGTCHEVGPDAVNKVGPTLNNMIDAPVAAVDGYKYGASILALQETGAVWSAEELSAWLANPKKYLRAKLNNKKAKSKMTFKLKKEAERDDIIAYLASITETPDDSEQEQTN